MDLIIQQKLTKSEWNSIEVPVSAAEKSVLKLIQDGYSDVSIKYNDNNSLITFLKIEHNVQMENYLYNKFFAELVADIIKKHDAQYLKVDVKSKVTICKADSIRIEKNALSSLTEDNIYEILLLKLIDNVLTIYRTGDSQWMYHYFTLQKLINNKIPLINTTIVLIVHKMLERFEEEINYSQIIGKSIEYIEKNHLLMKYEDSTLYTHQKEIFTIVKDPRPKLVLYIAPTGTGKTLTPIGLANDRKVIFVCAARHVGLALARSAISMNKRVAFAFGCESADDIRLHYFSAKVYTKNKRSGGIQKVDNSVGDKVEIMICDIKSYIFAMYYMIAFTTKPKRDQFGEPITDDNGETEVEPDFEKLITYWDEPTITMDYEHHELHEVIKRNWKENMIPNMVLSSATLPKVHEIPETVTDFMEKFPGAVVHNIVSHDCRKSIPIIDSDGFVAMPHYMHESYAEILGVVQHCENYLTILRYFDLTEASKFIMYVNENGLIPRHLMIDRQFGSLDDINMQTIKLYYLSLLKNIHPDAWSTIYNYFVNTRERKIDYNVHVDSKGAKLTRAQSADAVSQLSRKPGDNKPGEQLSRTMSVQTLPSASAAAGHEQFPFNTNSAYVTTKDAHTLTDGPTIFLAKDVEKIAKFCIQQSNIPAIIMDDIVNKISQNNVLNEKISELEKELEDALGEGEDTTKDDTPTDKKKGRDTGTAMKAKLDKKTDKKTSGKSSVKQIRTEIDALTALVRQATLNSTFIPNKREHLEKWASDMKVGNVFTGDVDEDIVSRIMLLDGIADSWKVLLMMGIGVFTSHKNTSYTEIMKSLADEQRLFMIITSSDYIYGTNYQFCHGYISKDLNLTQEKILQAMGRIGRKNIQQSYTVRFRDNAQIVKLFTASAEKPETLNMNKLFNSKEE